MTIPVRAPSITTLFAPGQVARPDPKLFQIGPIAPDGKYRHWDSLRHLTPPAGLTPDEWWAGMKLARVALWKTIPLLDTQHHAFVYGLPDPALEQLHRMDRDASGRIEIGEQVTNPATRDRFIVSSLIEEAITSSQLEGAATTREIARDMLRSGRSPRDRSERMIANNYEAMNRIHEIRDQALTPDTVFELHRILTEGTLEPGDAAGRFRRSDEAVGVYDDRNQLLHRPPAVDELPARLERMCEFANDAQTFVHPVVRAILLHFWLAYDHPFVDGNGRTARALFYWAMLHHGYWLAEYLSISTILRRSPTKYGRSFLCVETDDNDATYFVLAQLRVIRRAIEDVHHYLKRKMEEVRETELLLRSSDGLNHRQLALLSHAVRHPDARYTVRSHRASHAVAYETARADLVHLAAHGLLAKRTVGKTHLFDVPSDLRRRLQKPLR